MKIWLILLMIMMIGLWVTSDVLAMESPNYRLEWFTPLTGSGGQMSSANYQIELTLGQTAIGALESSSYSLCLGFWCGELMDQLFLPLILR